MWIENRVRLGGLALNRAAAAVIADCMACGESASARARELSYLAGFRDALDLVRVTETE